VEKARLLQTPLQIIGLFEVNISGLCEKGYGKNYELAFD
jgi:hypothetical protein